MHEQDPSALSPGAEMFANRIRKNQKKLARWLKQQGITCYRLYDADMPEYAVAIDLYGDHAHVQEYAPPKSVDPARAAQRLADIKALLPSLLEIPPEQIIYKERRPQKGRSQYQKQQPQAAGPWQKGPRQLWVQEGGARLLVNLEDYLDVGLFLDHRPVRMKIGQMARGKRFLNLFCYTATATVHAALGGAVSSLSVDMSKTYLDWASKNFRANQMDLQQHRLLREDCLQWLAKARGRQFDLIMLDPPSFSNSKKMRGILDVQRDHVTMIRQAMGLLSEEGTLIFSNNLRRFQLDAQALSAFQVEDISARSIDRDFQQNPRIHHCFLIRHGSARAQGK